MAPEDGGEESHRPPPHPLDRIWVHPSELGNGTGGRSRRPRWLTGVITATIAGLAVGTGVLIFAGFVADTGTSDAARSATDDAIADEALTSAVVLVTAAGSAGPETASGLSLGDGQVVTSGHLVHQRDSIVVTTEDGFHDARLVGRDDVNDLALLEVDAPLPAAPLGRADLLADDARVVAIAALPNDHHWVRASKLQERHAIAESADGDALFADLLGTDLPTTSRHAGGALVSTDGAVVGVLVSPPGTEMTGAALPIEKVTVVCEQIRRKGHADHGWVGVVAHDASEGVRIRDVVENGPAEDAGIRKGDVVVAVSARALEDTGELAAAVRARRPGDDLAFTVLRNGHERTIEVSLGELDPRTHATP